MEERAYSDRDHGGDSFKKCQQLPYILPAGLSKIFVNQTKEEGRRQKNMAAVENDEVAFF